MPTTVELQKMFKYSLTPIALTALALLLLTLLFILLIVLNIIRNKKAGRKNTNHIEAGSGRACFCCVVRRNPQKYAFATAG